MNTLLLASAVVASLAPGIAWADEPAVAPRKVVLDPGHGGSNAGALGSLVLEKNLTLALAELVTTELAELAKAEGLALEVSLTRRADQTLTLRQRSDIANLRGADLFVSLHGNASVSRAQRGFETYVLTPAAVEGIALALRGDQATPRPGTAPQISSVLDDIERGATQWEAADLAVAVQRELRQVRGAAGDRGVRQDAHHVLLGATMPAVLVEVGFVDHPQEGRELAEPALQRELARAIARAIMTQLNESPRRSGPTKLAAR